MMTVSSFLIAVAVFAGYFLTVSADAVANDLELPPQSVVSLTQVFFRL